MPVSSATSTPCQTPDLNSRPLDASLVVLPLFLLGFLLARYAAPVFALLPSCTFRAAFGFPCPSCGMTRAGLALAQGELQSALTFNPLFTAGVGILSLWSAGRWLEKFSGKESNPACADKIPKKILQVHRREKRPRGVEKSADKTFYRRFYSLRGKRLRWLTISAIVFNWLYLIISA